jgi:MFS transporter, DHA3 family, tetracycline resistance protein
MRKRGAASIYIMLSGASSLFFSMLLTIELVYLALIVGFSPLQLVLIGTVRQGISFLFQAPTGALADIYGRRWAVIVGVFLIGAGYFIEGAIPVLAVVLAAQVLIGLGVTLMDGADTAWIADEIGVERAGQIYIRAAQVGSLASLLGIAISAVLVNVRLNLPIVLGGSLFIVLSGVLALVMPEQNFRPLPREHRTSWQQMYHTLRVGVRLVRLRPVLLTILSIAILLGVFSAGFDQLWQYYLLHRFTFPVLGSLTSITWFCIIEAGISATNFCGTWLAGRYVDTNSPRSVVVALFTIDGLMVLTVIGFALAGQFILALTLFFLFTTIAGPRIALERVWTNQNVDSSVRATVFSLRGQVSAFAQIVGGPILGAVATAFDTRTALIAAGIVLSPAMLLYARTMRRDTPLTNEAEEQ